jgi:hypothetical protein
VIDRVIRVTISTPKVDKLVTLIMVLWVLVIVARVAGQILGGV